MQLTLDSYTTDGAAANTALTSNGAAAGQVFKAAYPALLDSAVLYLSYSSTAPVGSLTAKLYAVSGVFGSTAVPTGSPLAVSGTINDTALTTSNTPITFTFSGANCIALTSGTVYAIVVEVALASGTIELLCNNTNPTHAGNQVSYSSGIWSASSTLDVPFTVYASIANISKSYLYKGYRDGQFLGLLPNVTSEFGYSQDINTAGSQITINVAVSPDTSALPLDTIDDETGDPLEDEDGDDILSEAISPIVGSGSDTTLVRNGNKVQVWEYSKYHPDGICRFRGEIERLGASFGDDSGDEGIDILVYSDGQDLNDALALGSPYESDQSHTAHGSSFSVFGAFIMGQTFTTGGSITNIGAIDIFVASSTGVSIPVTVSLWPSVADAQSGTGLLGSVTQNVSNTSAGVVKFAFTTPIAVSSATQYFFTVSAPMVNDQTLGLYYDTHSYAGGQGYIAYTIEPIDLYFVSYSNDGETVAVFTSQDPSTMLTAVLDTYIAQGGLINYAADTVDATGLSLSYTFNTTAILDMINTILSLAPDGFYWYIDLGSNTLYFKRASASADLYITKGREINSLKLIMTIENIKNTDYEVGGKVGSFNLFSRYKDANSISEFGVRLNIHTDNRVTLQSTQDAIGQSFIAENKDEQYQTSVTILDDMMDITTLKLGQIVGPRGFGTFVDNLALQIVHIDYTPQQATLTLGALPPRTSVTLAQITRNLIAQQTVDNPSTPN